MEFAYPRHLPLRHRWSFPLPRTHTGVPLGNGRFGVLAWGEGRELRLTLGLGDLWDHRGGHPWTDEMTFARLRSLLEAKDEKGLREVFELHEVPAGKPRRPSVLPVGRIDVVFPEGWSLDEAELDFPTGTLLVAVTEPGGARRRLRCGLAKGESLLWIAPAAGGGLMPSVELVARPSWDWVGEHLATVGFQPPTRVEGAGIVGWSQPLPEDPAVAVAAAMHDDVAWISVARGADAIEAGRAAAARVDAHGRGDLARIAAEEAATWAEFWASAPDVELPESEAADRFVLGLYRFGAATRADGPAVTLQGPWIEEHQLPPWQSDYHFNINVQMCAWPAFGGNRLSDLVPLFDMVDSWREQLRENARKFVGVDDGLLLPHAVDDRAMCMGGFWTGTVDQACTGWMALTMMDAWRHGFGDHDFLRDRVKPWLRGALRVFEAMTERLPDGKRVLPVSVSPEYRANRLDAWGANASFQLGCIHAVVEALEEVAAELGESPEPWWRDLADGLPKACVGAPGGGRPRILLWEGTDLEESHRHHSHWASVFPWDVIEPEDPAWKDIVEATWRRWWEQGMGLWTGWCISWAAMLHARMGRPMMAAALPDLWERLYVNEGRGTLHDPRLMPDGGSVREPETRPPAVPFDGRTRGELMQLDAGFAITAATLDLLVHVRRGVHHLFTGCPPEWATVGFSRVRTRGAFLVSARRVGGRVARVEVTSERGRVFRLRSPWGAAGVLARYPGQGSPIVVEPDAQGILAVPTRAGATIELAEA